MATIRSLTAAFAAAALAVPAFAQDVTLKVHHFWPPGAMGPSTILAPWCDKIAKDSGNRMKCQVYPAMQLGGTPGNLIDQVKDGVADIVWTLPGYTAGRFPMMEVFELPFMSSNAEATSQAAWDYYTQYGNKEFPGIKALALHVHDNGYIHTNPRQVKVMADFKGLRMRAPTRQTNKMLGALGATPVAMPLPQLAESISKGVVDGYLLPWEVIPSIKAHELTKFESETDPKFRSLYTAVFIFAMNQAKYDSLPPDLKKVIDANSGLATSAWLGKTQQGNDAIGRKAAADRGNQIHTFTAAEAQEFIKLSARVDDEWVADMDKRGFKGAALLDTAKSLIAKHGKG